MHFILGDWWVEGQSLLVTHTFDLGIITMPICRADKRAKFLPPFWEPILPLKISSDSLTGAIGIDISPFPWLLFLPERVAVGCSRGNLSGSLLSRFYEPRDFCMSGGRAWHSWWPISFTQEGNLPFWCGGGSQFLFSRPQQGCLHNIIPTEGHQEGHALLELPGSSAGNAGLGPWCLHTSP